MVRLDQCKSRIGVNSGEKRFLDLKFLSRELLIRLLHLGHGCAAKLSMSVLNIEHSTRIYCMATRVTHGQRMKTPSLQRLSTTQRTCLDVISRISDVRILAQTANRRYHDDVGYLLADSLN
jgi:hypothetical protein